MAGISTRKLLRHPRVSCPHCSEQTRFKLEQRKHRCQKCRKWWQDAPAEVQAWEVRA